MTDPASASFEDLHKRLSAGDEQAAEQIFQRYAARLVGLARTRMAAKLQQKVDAEDVVQSALRSFFVRQRDGRVELTNWDGLWGLLARITLRKCSRNLERFTAARRDLSAEAGQRQSEDSLQAGWEAVSREPTSQEAAELTDLLEQLLSRVDDEQTAQALVMRLQGFLVSEIAEELGCTERSVQRKLGRVRDQLSAMLGQPIA